MDGGWRGAGGPGQQQPQQRFDDVLYVEDEPHDYEEESGSELGELDDYAAAVEQGDDDDDDESEGYSAQEPGGFGEGEDEWLDGGSEAGWGEGDTEEDEEYYGVEFSQMGLMSPTAAASCDVTSSSFDVTPGRRRRTSLLRVGHPDACASTDGLNGFQSTD